MQTFIQGGKYRYRVEQTRYIHIETRKLGKQNWTNEIYAYRNWTNENQSKLDDFMRYLRNVNIANYDSGYEEE